MLTCIHMHFVCCNSGKVLIPFYIYFFIFRKSCCSIKSAILYYLQGIGNKTNHVFINVILYDCIVYYIIVILVYVVTDRQVAVYCCVSDAPSATGCVKNARTCAFVVALMYWVVHAMLNASVILPPWPSRPT